MTDGKSDATSMPWTTLPPSKPAILWAKSASKWTGLRSPLTSEYRATSDSEKRLDCLSTSPTLSSRVASGVVEDEDEERKEMASGGGGRQRIRLRRATRIVTVIVGKGTNPPGD